MSYAYLLLEISSILLIDQHEIEIIPNTKLLVYFPERRSQIKPSQEQTNGYRLSWTGISIMQYLQEFWKRTSHGCAVHDLELGDSFALVILVRRSTGSFSTND